MSIIIRSLNLATFYAIREALGNFWCSERHDYYNAYGEEECDVLVNIDKVKVEPYIDGVWLFVGERVYKLERIDFREITIF